jgi:hypothetical protein
MWTTVYEKEKAMSGELMAFDSKVGERLYGARTAKA